MKVGLFIDTFDPFTIAHMAIVEKVLEKNIVDRVVIMPLTSHCPDKSKDRWLDLYTSVQVVKLFINCSKYKNRISISAQELEFERKHFSWTIKKRRYIDRINDYVIKFKNNRPNEDLELYTIIWPSFYKEFKVLDNWEEILSKTKLLVIQNHNTSIAENEGLPRIDIFIDEKFSHISTSEVKQHYTRSKYG